MLPSGRPFRLASDMALTAVDAGPIFRSAREGGVVSYNGGGDFFLVGSRFAVSGHHAGILMRMLPPIVHIWRDSDKAVLRWSGTIPPQKWMNFYTKVVSKYASNPHLKLTVGFEVPVEGDEAGTREQDARTALRELGLSDDATAS